MAEQQTTAQTHEHHHHHHHHKPDAASLFKRRSLASLERRKTIEKVLKIALITIAVLLAIATVIVYKVN